MTEEILEVEKDLTVVEPFDVNVLDDIDFFGNGKIMIDGKSSTRLNSQDILEQNGILCPNDSPQRIIIFADKTEQERRIGILADMGNHDIAGLYLTKQILASEDDLPLFTITRIEPLRNGINKYNHSEMQCGNLVEDPDLSDIFTQLADLFIPSEEED